MPRLAQWHFGADQWTGGFVLPTQERKFLHGQIFEDAERPDRPDLANRKFSDGDFVFTSLVKTVDLTNKTAQTLNTLYQLGEPSSAYAEWCKERGIELVPTVVVAAQEAVSDQFGAPGSIV